MLELEQEISKPRMGADKHGFRAARLAHLLGEPMVLCQGLVSASIGVHLFAAHNAVNPAGESPVVEIDDESI